MKKYKLVEKSFFPELVRELWQIEAISDFNGVKIGDRGGWIESENSLSQFDNAWVYGDACVYGHACVFGNACVCGNSSISGNARISGNSRVYGDARVSGDDPNSDYMLILPLLRKKELEWSNK